MYVCLCKSVTDHEIKRTIAEGANSFREVRDQLAVSTQCGKCARLARAVVMEALEEQTAKADFYNAGVAVA